MNQITILTMKYLVACQKTLHYAGYEDEVHYLHINESNHYILTMKYLVACQKTLHYAGYEDEVHYLHINESNHYILTMKYLVAWQVHSLSQSTSDIQLSLSLFLSSKIQKYICS